MTSDSRFAIRERDDLKHKLRRAQFELDQVSSKYKALQDICRTAINNGDWRVDGACDPDHLLERAS